MKIFAKTVLVAVSLLLSVGQVFGAEVNAPALDPKGAAKSIKTGVKADAKASAAAVKQDAKGKAVDAKGKIIDINTATEAELKAVPGIGEAYAAKIVAGRPYANKAQLKSRKILPGNVYEQVKDMIIAKIPKK